MQYEKYEDTAEQVYRILLKHSAAVMMLSCDEAFVDVSGLGDPEEVAATIRAQVDGVSRLNSVRRRDLSEQCGADQSVSHEFRSCPWRMQVFGSTKCTASIGIGPNMLLAKLATNTAKPDGLFRIRPGAETDRCANAPNNVDRRPQLLRCKPRRLRPCSPDTDPTYTLVATMLL